MWEPGPGKPMSRGLSSSVLGRQRGVRPFTVRWSHSVPQDSIARQSQHEEETSSKSMYCVQLQWWEVIFVTLGGAQEVSGGQRWW